MVIPTVQFEFPFWQNLARCDYFRKSLKIAKAYICKVVGEHQNFCNPFFNPFFRQHSPVPILTGFFKKTINRDVDQKTDLSSSAKQVVHPVH